MESVFKFHVVIITRVQKNDTQMHHRSLPFHTALHTLNTKRKEERNETI